MEMLLKLNRAQIELLSEALTQYVENSEEVPEVYPNDPETPALVERIAVAEDLLDQVNCVIAGVAA